jgi:hypothetical protein
MNLFVQLIDYNSGQLTYSVDGVTQTATILPDSKPLHAALNRFTPNDPVRPIVSQWNTRIESIKGPVTFGQTNLDIPGTFSGITADFADAGGFMQIQLKPHSDIVASLRPIPFIPPNPV